jgi:hypothetical protein
MTQQYCRDVLAFHDKFGLVTPLSFTFLEKDLLDFRVKFFWEEFNEYIDAYRDGDLYTAIDSLIDLVYITCGTALLHGIGPDEFVSGAQKGVTPTNGSMKPYADPSFFAMYGSGNEPGVPHLLSEINHAHLITSLDRSINDFVRSYSVVPSEQGVRLSLSFLYANCLSGASWMGFTQEQWDLLWNDVQRANLSKERVLRSEDSKRGSTYDVRKPPGWQPPRTQEIVDSIISQIQRS